MTLVLRTRYGGAALPLNRETVRGRERVHRSRPTRAIQGRTYCRIVDMDEVSTRQHTLKQLYFTTHPQPGGVVVAA